MGAPGLGFGLGLDPNPTPNPNQGRLKVADFGLSHVVATKAGPPKASPKASPKAGALKEQGLKEPLLHNAAAPPEDDTARDPSIVGTPFYMAPEVILGKARGVEVASA